MTDGLTLEQRLAKLEAKDEIRELVAHYGIVIDDRDLDGIEALFTRDGSFRSKDGVLNAIGRDAVMEQFRARFAVLGPTNHFAHEHIITLDTTDCASAAGLVTSHAEVWRIRYRHDRCIAVRGYLPGGGWTLALCGAALVVSLLHAHHGVPRRFRRPLAPTSLRRPPSRRLPGSPAELEALS